jgi:hypothetical protein
MVEIFQCVTGLKAQYADACSREGMLKHFPQFAANELLVREALGMVEFAVEYGYLISNMISMGAAV